jgi:hypothetical protein
MDTYKSLDNVTHVDLTIDQYKADLKEAFTIGLNAFDEGIHDTPDESFDKFYKDHAHRRKI